MKPWHEVVVPHRDIREGKFDEAVFAADLSDVVAGRGPLEYRDPVLFFRTTYPTQGLRRLLSAVFLRLTGKGKGEAVIQIETPFGGGKTHSLIALYHLFKHGKELKGQVSEFLEDNAPEIPPTQVATFVGTMPDPLAGKTPWGEIAACFGQYDLVREHDVKRRAPGKEILHRLIGDAPTLILMDEVAEYLVKAKDFADQTLAFLQELTETVKVLPRCALVVTLPSSAPYGEEGERALQQLQRIFGRVETIHTPVEGEEIYEVIRRRLFESIGDPQEIRRMVEEFFEMYRSLRDDLPREVQEASYRKRMERAYPFHPELIDILLEHWSTFPNFQRTRGVLRFLAEIVADLYQRQDPSPLILPSQINLDNSTIRRELLKHIGNAFEGVIAADIAGVGAKAPKIDQEIGSEYARFRIASGLATAIFFGSFSGSEKRGVSIQRLRLAVLRKGIHVALIGDTLRRLEEALWYLHAEGGLYSFSSQPNLNRVIVEKEETVREEDIEGEIRKFLEGLAGRECRVFLWPQSLNDIPDTRELKLAILPPYEDRENPKTAAFVEELLKKAGSSFRTYQNTLLVLLADRNELSSLRQNVKKLLALRAVERDLRLMQQLPEEKKTGLRSRIREFQDDIPFRIQATYRHLAKAGQEKIAWFDLGLPTVGERGSLAKRVLDFLRAQDLLLETIAPHVLLRKALPEGETERSLRDIVDAFLRYPHLPMVVNLSVLHRAIEQGVKEGAFGLYLERVYFREFIPQTAWEEEKARLIRKEAIVLPETKSEATTPTTPPTATPEPQKTGTETRPPISTPTPPPQKAKGYSNVHLRVKVPWDKLSDIVRGVVFPLRGDRAELTMVLEIQAFSPEGSIRESTLEEKVKETLRQIGAEVLEEKIW
ncbi:MAG: ATP-binding protein [Candidatus Atribacteria bacterium]|nr:ATP-binding protein [Candidatus Atribacteria bacterium]